MSFAAMFLCLFVPSRLPLHADREWSEVRTAKSFAE